MIVICIAKRNHSLALVLYNHLVKKEIAVCLQKNCQLNNLSQWEPGDQICQVIIKLIKKIEITIKSFILIMLANTFENTASTLVLKYIVQQIKDKKYKRFRKCQNHILSIYEFQNTLRFTISMDLLCLKDFNMDNNVLQQLHHTASTYLFFTIVHTKVALMF